jgi:hypothetical protein
MRPIGELVWRKCTHDSQECGEFLLPSPDKEFTIAEISQLHRYSSISSSSELLLRRFFIPDNRLRENFGSIWDEQAPKPIENKRRPDRKAKDDLVYASIIVSARRMRVDYQKVTSSHQRIVELVNEPVQFELRTLLACESGEKLQESLESNRAPA